MRGLGWLFPTGRGWLYSTETVEVGDMLHVPWPVFCKDRNVIVMSDHDWLSAHGGHVLVKYRWGVVHRKDARGKLYMWLSYAFSNTSMADKRLEVIEDEETGELRAALQDYVHIVTTDEGNKDQVVGLESLCFEKGLKLNYKSVNRFRAEKKQSFLKMEEVCIHENGTPLQVRAKPNGKEEIKNFLKIHEEIAKRTKAALDRAAQNWSNTPAAGSTANTVLRPVVTGPTPGSDQGTVEVQVALPEAPMDIVPAQLGNATDPRGMTASTREQNDIVDPQDQMPEAPADIAPRNFDNSASQGSSTNDRRPPGTLIGRMALQTAFSGSKRQNRGSNRHQTNREQLQEALNPSRSSRRDQDRKRQPDSPERDGRPPRRRRRQL